MRKCLRTAGAAMMAAAFALAAPQAAEAALVTAEFTISGNWAHAGPARPFGLPDSPVLTGEVVFDNSKTGRDAFVSFSLVTGSRTWSEADIAAAPGAADVTFAPGGQMADFYAMLGGGGDGFFIYGSAQPAPSAGGIHITEDFGQSAGSLYCTNCLVVTANAVQVPEPAAMALLGAGLLGLGAVRRRARARAA